MHQSPNTSAGSLAAQYVAAVNAGDADQLDELLSAEFVDHHLPPEFAHGIAGAKDWLRMLHQALELHVDVLDIVEREDRVAVRARITGRHVGDFAGVPATGRPFDATYLSIERIEAGRIVERWEIADQATLAAQLSGEAPA